MLFEEFLEDGQASGPLINVMGIAACRGLPSACSIGRTRKRN